MAKIKKSKREPEVILFEEPQYNPRKRGREAVREKDRFLVSPCCLDENSLIPSFSPSLPQRGDVSEIFSSLPDGQVKTTAEPSTSQFDLKETLREVQSLGEVGFQM